MKGCCDVCREPINYPGFNPTSRLQPGSKLGPACFKRVYDKFDNGGLLPGAMERLQKTPCVADSSVTFSNWTFERSCLHQQREASVGRIRIACSLCGYMESARHVRTELLRKKRYNKGRSKRSSRAAAPATTSATSSSSASSSTSSPASSPASDPPPPSWLNPLATLNTPARGSTATHRKDARKQKPLKQPIKTETKTLRPQPMFSNGILNSGSDVEMEDIVSPFNEISSATSSAASTSSAPVKSNPSNDESWELSWLNGLLSESDYLGEALPTEELTWLDCDIDGPLLFEQLTPMTIQDPLPVPIKLENTPNMSEFFGQAYF